MKKLVILLLSASLFSGCGFVVDFFSSTTCGDDVTHPGGFERSASATAVKGALSAATSKQSQVSVKLLSDRPYLTSLSPGYPKTIIPQNAPLEELEELGYFGNNGGLFTINVAIGGNYTVWSTQGPFVSISRVADGSPITAIPAVTYCYSKKNAKGVPFKLVTFALKPGLHYLQFANSPVSNVRFKVSKD